MGTINGYMVVAQGGSYSDKYHYNERFYLDRSEAVAYIESKKEATREWNQFVALCPKSPYRDYLAEDKALSLFPHFIEKVKSLYFLVKEDEETDLQIEEIDIPVGSRLYKLLKESE